MDSADAVEGPPLGQAAGVPKLPSACHPTAQAGPGDSRGSQRPWNPGDLLLALRARDALLPLPRAPLT